MRREEYTTCSIFWHLFMGLTVDPKLAFSCRNTSPPPFPSTCACVMLHPSRTCTPPAWCKTSLNIWCHHPARARTSRHAKRTAVTETKTQRNAIQARMYAVSLDQSDLRSARCRLGPDLPEGPQAELNNGSLPETEMEKVVRRSAGESVSYYAHTSRRRYAFPPVSNLAQQ